MDTPLRTLVNGCCIREGSGHHPTPPVRAPPTGVLPGQRLLQQGSSIRWNPVSAPRSGIPWATAVLPFSSFAGPAVDVTAAFDDMEDIPVISFLFAIYLFISLTFFCPAGDFPLQGFVCDVTLFLKYLCMKNSLYSYLFTCPTSVGPLFSLYNNSRLRLCYCIYRARLSRLSLFLFVCVIVGLPERS